MNFKRLSAFLGEIFKWVLETELAILFVVVLINALLFGFYTWHSELSVRASGYALQLLGMIFAVNGLVEMRSYFKQQSLWEIILEWWNRRPWKKHPIKLASNSSFMNTMTVRISQWAEDNPEDFLENRIDRIIWNLKKIKEAQRHSEKKLDELYERHEKNQKEQEQKHMNMDKELRSHIESSLTRDIFSSLIGLVWLTFGITMSTMAKELSEYFNSLTLFTLFVR